MDNKKKKIVLALTTFMGTAVLGLGILTTNIEGEVPHFRIANSETYSLTLNSGNKVTSDGTVNQKTATGNDMPFTYSNVASSTSGHVTLNKGGTLINDNMFKSISELTINFTSDKVNPLTFQLGYVPSKLNAKTYAESGKTYDLSASSPYFVKFTAEEAVTITSISFKYNCTENPNAKEYIEGTNYYEKVASGTIDDGNYLIVYEAGSIAFNGSLSTLDAIGNSVAVTISDDRIESTEDIDACTFTINETTGSYTIKSASGNYIGRSTDSNGLEANDTVRTNDISITDNGDANIVSEGGAYLRYNATSGQTRFRYYRSSTYTGQKAVALYKQFKSEGHYEDNTPSDLPVTKIGIIVEDTNANNYDEDSIYANENGLIVKEVYSDGSYKTITTGYTYVVKDQNGTTIDHTAKFGAQGNYKVYVSSGGFEATVINISVGVAIKLTSIVNHLDVSGLTINTASKLTDFISSRLTVDLHYNHSEYDVMGISYSELSEKDLTLALLNPSSVSCDINTPFGTAGTWKIKVSKGTLNDESSFTVEAIPVTNIGLNETSVSIEEEEQIQLNTTITPDNATNPVISWSSDDESVATVDNNGLVTGVAAGTTTINASATDGSGVVATCTVTVTAKPVDPALGEYSLMQTTAPSVGDYVIITGTKNTSVYAMSKTQNNNNRAAESGITVTNNKITKTASDSIGVFEIQEGNKANTYAFYDIYANGYLYAASSSANNLRTETSLSDNSSWTISGSTIIAQGTNTRNEMRFNSSNNPPIFSAYASTSTQPTVSLYVKDAAKVYPTAFTISGGTSVAIGSTLTFSANSWTPTDTNVKTVTWSTSNSAVATINNNGLLTPIKAGTTTISATAVGANDTQINSTNSITVTVTSKLITSITLSPNPLELTVGGSTGTLIPTITPSDASNKELTWSSDNSSVATVANGVVSPVSAGTVTITATAKDGSGKSGSATVTVTSSGGGGGGSGVTDVLTRETTGISGTTYTSWSGKSGESGAVYAGQSAGSNDSIQLRSNNSNSGIITTASGGDIYKITVVWNDATADGRTLTIYGKNSAYSDPTDLYGSNAGTELGTIVKGTSTEWTISGTTSYSYIGVRSASGALYMTSISFQWGEPEPVDPTGIELSTNSLSIGVGQKRTLGVTYLPSNANQNKVVEWSTGDSSIVDIDKTSGQMTAMALGTTSVTAKLVINKSVTASCTVQVVETSLDEWTLLFYVCGANLESSTGTYGRAATSDMREILNVKNQQPDSVNILVETGGAKSWGMSNVSANELGRFEISSSSSSTLMTKITDQTQSKTNMGLTSTLQDFIEWGIEYRPAKKYGLFMWDHGGAMDGCCYDELFDDDRLFSNELYDAVKNARDNLGMSEKLEFIAYDACLMAVQDIAEMNSHNFNYMLCSQETEYSGGYDYDTSFPTLYADPAGVNTVTFLSKIGDDFMNEQEADGGYDQTQSVLDLSYMDTYLTHWESMTETLSSSVVTSSSKWTTFANAVNTATKYGQNSDYSSDSDCNYGYFYDIFDVKMALNAIKSQYSTNTTLVSKINTLLNDLSNIVVYNRQGTQIGESNGLCMFCPLSGQNATQDYTYEDVYYEATYSTARTNFTKWQAFVKKYGNFYC